LGVFVLVSSAVDLDRKASRRAEEIGDIRAKDMLSTKADPAQALSSKSLP
jgi:hypothetical protein